MRPVFKASCMFALAILHLVPAAVRADGDWSEILTPPPRGIDVAAIVRPSARQLAYQEKQLGIFVHYGLPAFGATDADYAMVFPHQPGIADAKIFNPEKLDAEQWVLTAKAFGARHVIFPAKHHDGFCLWPTKTTDYSVKSSPWKNGQGDLVREVVEACKKHAMPMGIYCSPADKKYGCFSTPADNKLHGDRDAYFAFYKEQLRELLTNSGSS